jgi:undecaprenyl-diphosphatase
MSSESWSAALLGVVQGLTEFLPVSSSGHLVIFQKMFPVSGDNLAFDLVLHVGTLLPVLWVYRAEILSIFKDFLPQEKSIKEREGLRLAGWIVLGSVPTAAIGLLFEDWFETIFSTPQMVSIAFAVTGSVLFSIRYISQGERGISEMVWWHALLIGTVQGLAITPGISRSGSTIAAALFLGLNRPLAAKYSFLLSIPAIMGGFILKLDEIQSSVAVGTVMIGFCTAIVSGYLALRWLLKLVNGGNFSQFCWYLWFIALCGLLFPFIA